MPLVRLERQHGRGVAVTRPVTAREVQVLQGFADGLGRKQIATRLGISENTVASHTVRIREALGAGAPSSPAGLVGWAFRAGLVT